MKKLKTPPQINKGEQKIAKLKKLKPEFDKLSYPEKLKFFEDNDLQSVYVQYYFFVGGEDRNEPENHITIFPQNETECTLYFNYRFSCLKKQDPLRYDIEKMKENYFKMIDENDYAIYYTQTELDEYINTRNRYIPEGKTGLRKQAANAYDKGFHHIAFREKIDFVNSDFNNAPLLIDRNAATELLIDGMIAADFIKFLKEQKKILEEEEKKPKKEETKIDGIKNWNNKERTYLLIQIGIENLELFKSLGQNKKYELIANILNCSPRKARENFNHSEKLTFEQKKDIENYLNELS